MARPAKSQWDFGELFPVELTSRKVLSVAELTVQIRRLLEQQIGRVWVTGEITNFRTQSSGHIYFVLKDANAQISCVLFRGEMQVERELLQDGRKVVLQGELSVYESRGQYQLRILRAELQGVGALQVAFERLKQKLNTEGLFAQERKRPLPRFPERIGLVTSPTGAAIRDVLHVIGRRNPSLEVILAPCRVQGEGAAVEISAALRLLNQFHLSHKAGRDGNERRLDLILVTRGGGSLEDLWPFNEEIVARAIFHSALPVISAIGHEIDFSISDFVADYRAATPSAAAEIITEGIFSSCQFIASAENRMKQLLHGQIGDKKYELERSLALMARLHPRHRLEDSSQRLDDLQGTMLRCIKQGLRRERLAWRTLCERLVRVRPALLLKHRRELLHQRERRLREKAQHRLSLLQDKLSSMGARLRLLGPEQVLARGYSITLDAESGKVMRNANQAIQGQKLKTRLQEGELISRVEPEPGS